MPIRQLKRQTVRLLVCDREQGLGYCCPYVFFSLYPSTSLIAARLGVTTRAVRYYKAQLKAGDLRCEERSNCMKSWITE